MGKNCRFSLITQNMKLLVAFIAGSFADTAVREECPDYLNPDTKGWKWNTETLACDPINVKQECGSDHMKVTFNKDHVYLNLDSENIGANIASAYAGSCKDASVTSNNNGEYEITFKYAECDTSAQQIYEKDVRNDIVISNTMNGNSEGLYAHGIRTTSALSLDVQCVYPAEITIDLDLSVEDALFEAEDAGEDGTVKPEFVFKGYSDEARTNPINATHPAEIGDTIYTEMSVKDNIFKRFKFHMRQFTAFPDDTRNSTGVHFDLVDNCKWTGNAVNVLKAKGELSGQVSDSAEQQFNGFAFGDLKETEIFLPSHVDMCLLDADGNQVDSACPHACT